MHDDLNTTPCEDFISANLHPILKRNTFKDLWIDSASISIKILQQIFQ